MVLPLFISIGTHTLSDHWIQQVVIRTKDDRGILHKFPSSIVRAGLEPFPQRHQVFDVPGFTQPMDPLQGVLVPHLLHTMVEPA